MQSMVVKLGGIALAVAALAAIVGTFMPTRIASAPQNERIADSARVAGASNVRLRAAEAEAQRGPTLPSAGNQTPVVQTATSVVGSDASQPVQSNGYTGTVPVPQTVFEGEDQQEAAADSPTDPTVED